MNDVKELKRLPSPAPKPQSLAWDGDTLWMGSIETNRVYALDERLKVLEDHAAPGKPYGMAALPNELRVLCAETADDHRIIRRLVHGKGFQGNGAVACPDDTGSQLAYDGERLSVSQWYKQKVVTLDAAGNTARTLDAPRGICGLTSVDGLFYLLTTADEKTDDYWLTSIDPHDGAVRDIARVPFKARALAFDGAVFWTNHRERDQIVAFERPE